MEFIESKRCGVKMVLDGYAYNKKRTNADGSAKYVCVKSCNKKFNCKSTVKLDSSNNILEHPICHTHAGDGDTAKIQDTMRKRAREDTTPLPTIYDQEKVKILASDDVNNAASNLPTFRSMSKSLYAQRRKAFPNMPKSPSDISLTERFNATLDGKSFVMFDEETPSHQRFLTFGTDDNLRNMCDEETIFMDGTFGTCPRLFYQIYTIFAFVCGILVPIASNLLPNKTEATYVNLLTRLTERAQQLGRVLYPRRVMVDFELAMINAVRKVFPGCVVKGCFFHYSQALWRKLQNLGLSKDYEREDIHTWFRLYIGLAFIPLCDIELAFNYICEQLTPDVQACRDFNDYFYRTWMAGSFTVDMWNQFGILGLRTNNAVEGYHHRLKRKAVKNHPNIYEIVNVFQHEEASSRVSLLQINNGKNLCKKRKVNSDIDEQLQRYAEEYCSYNRDMYSYLKACGYLFDFKFVCKE